MPYCTKCGNELLPDAIFCSKCGTQVTNRERVDYPEYTQERSSLQHTPVTDTTPEIDTGRLENKEGGLFERLVQDIFDHAGFSTKRDVRIPLTETSVENQEIDIIAESNDVKVVIECKDRQDVVPTIEINSFVGKFYTIQKTSTKPVYGVFAVSKRETQKYAEFRRFLLDKGVSFWDADKIEEMQKASHDLGSDELYAYILRGLGTKTVSELDLNTQLDSFETYRMRFICTTIPVRDYIGGKLTPDGLVRVIENKLPKNIKLLDKKPSVVEGQSRYEVAFDFAIKVVKEIGREKNTRGKWDWRKAVDLVKGSPMSENLKSAIELLEDTIVNTYGVDKKIELERVGPVKE